MRQRTAAIALAIAALGAALLDAAALRGTPEEARAMLDKAIAHYTQVGRAQAIADFNAKRAPFADRDLYVFCIAKDHTIVANGAFPSFVNTNGDLLRDALGHSMAAQMWKAAEGGKGSVEYSWANPVTHQVEPKISFVRRAGEDICGVGAYRAR